MSEVASAAVATAVVASAGLGGSFVMPWWLASRRAARLGVIRVRQSFWQALRSARAVAFDKQGTITTGALTVIAVEPFPGSPARDVRWFAGALERHAQHPVGQAIAQRVPRGNVRHAQEYGGRGISGWVDRHPVRVGAPAWIGVEASTEIGVLVAVEVDGHPIGTITVADEVVDGIPAVAAALERSGLIPVLVTADSARTAEDLAERAGIGQTLSTVAPTDRPRVERDLIDRYGTIVVIGDEGHSIAIGGEHCTVTDRANPLDALAAMAVLAGRLPGRRRLAQAVSVVLALLAGTATLFLR